MQINKLQLKLIYGVRTCLVSTFTFTLPMATSSENRKRKDGAKIFCEILPKDRKNALKAFFLLDKNRKPLGETLQRGGVFLEKIEHLQIDN